MVSAMATYPQMPAYDPQALIDAFFAAPHMLVALMDDDFRFVQVNRAYAEAAKRRPEDFAGHGHFDLYPDAENESLFRRVLDSGQPVTMLARPFAHPDQPERGLTYWDWSLWPIPRRDGGKPLLLLTLFDVTEKVQAKILADEREVLLRELHHRVKNNLQIVTSLLALQKLKTPEMEAGLDMLISRIASIGKIHEMLGLARNLSLIDFGSYAKVLCEELEKMHGGGRIKIMLHANAELTLDLAVPLGLLVNELVTNSLKHAFPAETEGTITIGLRPDAQPGYWRLDVRDDGAGLPQDYHNRRSSLGLHLVQALTRQINGTLAVEPAMPGTRWRITFPFTRSAS